MLPQDFLKRMEKMLGEDYPAFYKEYERESYQALRINTLKGNREKVLAALPFHLTPVAWAENGFYYEKEDFPGKHPYHDAGVYYIQEPSAMLPSKLLEAKPGERILDLCAAPGGKSTAIAAAMKGEGILISNEIHPARAKILSGNIERMGIKNAIVTNESPEKLALLFEGYFDRIMVDAPCSGEGMFRKNGEACREWSPDSVRICAERQNHILRQAALMLKPGGTMVYSTCTFSREENEDVIERFLQQHPDFSLEQEERMWPHKIAGEGHFAAVLKLKGQRGDGEERQKKRGEEKGIGKREASLCMEFMEKYIKTSFSGILLRFGEQIYLAPEHTPSLKGIRVIRPGLHLGTMKKERFEPSHSLALALTKEQARYVLDLSSKERDIWDYLGGKALAFEGKKGWYLICVDGYGTGWGKMAGGMMKNHYPKGLRKNDCMLGFQGKIC